MSKKLIFGIALFMGLSTVLSSLLYSSQDPSQERGYIDFSFDQVDVRTFVKLVGDITGRKFVIADDVKGKLTVVSPRISSAEVYPLFLSILETSGCSVVESGNICRVINLPERGLGIAPVIGPDEKMPSDGVLTKVVHLKHVHVSEIKSILEPLISGGKTGGVGVLPESNHLIITDTASNIKRVEKLVQKIDQEGLSTVTEVVPLKFASSEDVADQLNKAMTQVPDRGQRLVNRLPSVPDSNYKKWSMVRVVATSHSNSLLLIGSKSQVDELKKIIAQMDIDTPSAQGRLNAIFLKYISADDAAKSITSLLAKSSASKTGSTEEQKIAIESSSANNALLVDAAPGDFEVVRKLIEQLDREVEQVHIEVVIAEMTVTDGLDLGVDMAAVDLPSAVGSTTVQGGSTLSEGVNELMNNVQQGIFPGGLTVGVAHGNSLDASGNIVNAYPGIINITALKKSGKLRIRSNPSLVAQNNKEASVSIVQEIPVLKSTIQGGSGSARDVIQNIDRVDVGIKLQLTPHIIPETKKIRMVLNPSIEAVIDPGPSDSPFTPTIAKREVSTTVTVPNGETIVIAGLTREDEISSEKRVPLLGSIPLLGMLFRSKSVSKQKINVLIFVTPNIVTSASNAADVERLWNKQTDQNVTKKE